MHAALLVALRHLLVKDAAARGHPLHVTCAHLAAIPETVAVLHRTREHIGDCLYAAMWMPRKPGEIGIGIVVAEVVEQQERIEIAGVAEAERAPQRNPAPSMVATD